MEPNWVMALDNLAAGGVIDFDAAAFLLDKPARFVGHPAPESLPLGNINYLPKGTKLKDVPQIDSFHKDKQDIDYFHNPTWKKVVVGTIVGAGVLGIGLAVLSKFVKLPFKMPKILSMPKIKFPMIKMPKIKLPKVKLPKLSSIGTKLKSAGAKIVEYVKKPISFIASKIKNIRK